MVILKANRPCRVAKNINGTTYTWIFDKNTELDVEEEYVNMLLDTGIIKKVLQHNVVESKVTEEVTEEQTIEEIVEEVENNG